MVFSKYINYINSKTLSVFFVKGISVLAGLFISILVSNEIGVISTGVYNVLIKTSQILLVINLWGLNQPIIKNISAIHQKRALENTSILQSSYLLATLLSIIIIISGIIFFIFSGFNKSEYLIPSCLILFSLPITTFSKIFSFSQIGLGKAKNSIMTEPLFAHGFFIILFFAYRELGNTFNLNTILTILLIAKIIGLCLSFLFFPDDNVYIKSKNSIYSLFKQNFSFALIILSYMIYSSAELYMLSFTNQNYATGIYSIAIRLALISNLILQTVNSIIAPKITNLYFTNSFKKFEKMILTISRGLLAISLFFLSLFVIFGKKILHLWGSDFVDGYHVLIILSLAQVINLCTGPSGQLLTLCGQQKSQMFLAISLIPVSILVSYFFVINFGLLGAAYAGASVIIIDNIVRVYIIYKKIGINYIKIFKI
jgi:O-antigen/teichoic acid export membrane protein